MFKKLLILPFFAAVLFLAGCEAQKDNAAIESAIAEAKLLLLMLHLVKLRLQQKQRKELRP